MTTGTNGSVIDILQGIEYDLDRSLFIHAPEVLRAKLREVARLHCDEVRGLQDKLAEVRGLVEAAWLEGWVNAEEHYLHAPPRLNAGSMTAQWRKSNAHAALAESEDDS
jgi:hypothetical protein